MKLTIFFRPRVACAIAATVLFATISSIAPRSFAQDASAPAATPAPQPTLGQIVEQQTQLREQVAGKRGAFKDMHEGDRIRLLNQQNRLLQLLEGRRSFDELRVEERVEVFNTLQDVNAAATKAEDERRICQRSPLVGTHRPQVVCMTGKQYREHKENAKKSLRTVMACHTEGACGGD